MNASRLAPKESITRQTRRYVFSRPALRSCLQQGIVNYSALARRMCDELGIGGFDAVVMALRRLHKRLAEQGRVESSVARLLSNAKIRIRTKTLVATVEKSRSFEKIDELQREIRRANGDFNLIEGEQVLTIITNQEYESVLKTRLRGKVIRLVRDLAQICLICDHRIESTPGVVAHIYGQLYDQGINVREEMSCWTDLMMMVDESDLPRALMALHLDSAGA